MTLTTTISAWLAFWSAFGSVLLLGKILSTHCSRGYRGSRIWKTARFFILNVMVIVLCDACLSLRFLFHYFSTPDSDRLCGFSAFMGTFLMLSLIGWQSVLAYSTIQYRYDNGERAAARWWVPHLCVWSLSLFGASIPFITQLYESTPATATCWIKKERVGGVTVVAIPLLFSLAVVLFALVKYTIRPLSHGLGGEDQILVGRVIPLLVVYVCMWGGALVYFFLAISRPSWAQSHYEDITGVLGTGGLNFMAWLLGPYIHCSCARPGEWDREGEGLARVDRDREPYTTSSPALGPGQNSNGLALDQDLLKSASFDTSSEYYNTHPALTAAASMIGSSAPHPPRCGCMWEQMKDDFTDWTIAVGDWCSTCHPCSCCLYLCPPPEHMAGRSSESRSVGVGWTHLGSQTHERSQSTRPVIRPQWQNTSNFPRLSSVAQSPPQRASFGDQVQPSSFNEPKSY